MDFIRKYVFSKRTDRLTEKNNDTGVSRTQEIGWRTTS